MSIPYLPDYPLPPKKSFPVNKVNWGFYPDQAVLLIHDMQDYFLKFYQEGSELTRRLIANINALKSFCHQQKVPVVYTAQPDKQTDKDRALLNDMWGAGLNDHAELKKICVELAPSAHDTVLVKWRYSAFQRSVLERMMRDLCRDQLLICGIYGHIGCLVTAVDAFMRDIKPFMIGDAIADFSEQDHLMAMRYIAGCAGKVVTTENIIQPRHQD
jgi:bifunctional isochorismate lyase/aryl carrier protein